MCDNEPMRIVKAGVLYFALVFGAGFVLGTIRTLWIVPVLGARTAELLETPIMCIGLLLMLFGEFTLVLWLRGLSIRQYLATRSPVAGSVYYIMLGVFVLMPLVVARR
jgi:hypothetical protein